MRFFENVPSPVTGKKKCAKRDGREFFLEQIGGRRIDRGEKREGEMDLRGSRKKSGRDNAGRARPGILLGCPVSRSQRKAAEHS